MRILSRVCHALVVQEDALLLGPSLEPFLEGGGYSYVGAPWHPHDGWVAGKPWLAAVGGNGGLSLRRRSHALACLDAFAWQRGQWEDAYFVEALQRLGHPVAPASAASAFAVERLPSARPCGLHKAYNYLAPPELKRLLGVLEEEYERRLERLDER